MNKKELKVKLLPHWDSRFEYPQYESIHAAGADLRACLPDKKEMKIAPGERVLVPTAMAMEIPVGHEIQIRPRSGLSYKTGLMVINSPGTIDADYRGEVKIILGNLGSEVEVIEHGQRIAQMVLCPVVQAKVSIVEELSDTMRGEGGFGSTGKN